MRTLSDYIKMICSTLPPVETGGEVTKKFRPSPKLKPKRRRPSVKNKTDRDDYNKEKVRQFREEHGYKIPPSVQKWRREQKKKHKEQGRSKKLIEI